MLCIACQQASKTIVTFGRARSLARIAENKLVKVCLAYQAKILKPVHGMIIKIFSHTSRESSHALKSGVFLGTNFVVL
jgi:hypothetical protein